MLGKQLHQPRHVLLVAGGQVLQQALDRGCVAAAELLQAGQVDVVRSLIARHRQHQARTEVLQADGFEQAVVHARRQAAVFFLGLGVGGEAEDQPGRQAPGAFFVTNRAGQRVAVHQRHIAVGDHHVERLRPPGAQAVGTVLGIHYLVAEVMQLLGEQQAVGRVVIDHQHLERPGGRRLQRRNGGRDIQLDQGGQADAHFHLGALPQHAVEHQAAAHHFAQGAADHQAQPRTATRRLAMVAGLGKRAEQLLLVFAGNPAAAVFHPQAQRQAFIILPRLGADPQAHVAAVGELDRIAQQVGGDLLEAQRVHQHLAVDAGVEVEDQLQLLLPRQAFKDARHRFHQLAQVGALRGQGQAAGFDARNVEDVADQIQQAPGRA